MSLSEIQFNEALIKASLDILKEGKVPSLSKLVDKIQKTLPQDVLTPTVKLRFQRWREQWDLASTNKSLAEVDFDLKVLYKALLELSSILLRRLNMVETTTRSQNAQMDRIESLARNLLFIIQNGDGYFDAFFEDFHDLSKVDQIASTKDVVDLKSQTALIPDSIASAKKYNFEHLQANFAWPVVVSANSSVIRSETPSDAPFKNMFVDTISMWRHDVITEESGPVSISFSFPVHRIVGAEASISRIQLVGASEFTQRAEVTYSVDGINYLKFSGNSGIVELDKSSRVVDIDFPLTRVEFIKITLYRSQPDKALDIGYLTSFGLRSMSAYILSRGYEAELVSTPFYLEEGERLDKIALSVHEEIPPGTDINYFVCPIDKEETDDLQKEIDGEWIAITPLNRIRKRDEPSRLVRTSTLSDKSYRFVPETPMDPIYTYKGISFYQINSTTQTKQEVLIKDDVVYKTALLNRGNNVWLRKNSNEQTLFKVEGNFISFSTGPRQKLYTTAQETVSFAPALRWNDVERSTIEVSRPVDFRPNDGMSLICPDGLDPYSVPDPLHAIYEISLINAGDEQSEVIVFPSSGTGKVKFNSSPIDISEKQEVNEYLSAYRPNLGTHDESLIAELESRSTLASYHGKTIKSLTSLSTPADVAAGKPQLTKIVIGNDDGAVTLQERTIVGEIIETYPTPAASVRTLSELSDTQILALFGKVKIRTTFTHGIYGILVSDPTKTYEPGVHFELEVINDPVTGVPDLYVSRTPDDNSRPYSIAAGASVTFKFKYKKDLTRNVLAIQGNRIYLDKKFSAFTNENSGFQVKVGYRYVPVGTNEVLKESLEVYSETKETKYISGKDYHFNPIDGTITLIPSGAISSLDGKTAAYASFTHKGALNALQTFSIWGFVKSKDPVKIHYDLIEIDSSFGEKVLVSTGNGAFVDISSTTETPELANGWHQFIVLSRDPDVYSGTAIRKMAELVDLNDQPVFLAGGDYFSEIVGTRVPMTQVTIDFLKNSVLPTDHSKFAIDEDGKVVVNFQPNTQQDFYTYGYRKTGEDQNTNTPDFYNEEFGLEYRYHRDEARTINGVLFRAVLSRSKDSNSGVTPKLGGYQIRIG